ncbi:carbohydrate ABC transporter permease [Embleya sp. AB8]|uniref:carbohydrate ABC transporter permease n=1 Tax=Embleya sp. AB8 TaxID=3156304 RepID=UPI003C764002
MSLTLARSKSPTGTAKSRARAKETRAAGLFLLPAFIGFAVFYLYPTGRGIWISLTDWNLLSDPKYVGTENYAEVIKDPQFWNAIKVTAYFVFITLGVQVVVALMLAAIMVRLTGSVVVRALLLVPWLVPNVTIGLIWLWMLDANLGFVNHLLDSSGADTHGFFASPDEALASISMVNVWAGTGYVALLLYAGMLQIPGELYESASLDGAGEIRMFFKITLPLLRPILALVMVVSVIGSFQIFDTIAVTTKGGPVDATRVAYYYIYQEAFTHFRMGYAAAMALCLVVVLGGLTWLQMRLLRASTSDLA